MRKRATTAVRCSAGHLASRPAGWLACWRQLYKATEELQSAPSTQSYGLNKHATCVLLGSSLMCANCALRPQVTVLSDCGSVHVYLARAQVAVAWCICLWPWWWLLWVHAATANWLCTIPDPSKAHHVAAGSRRFLGPVTTHGSIIALQQQQPQQGPLLYIGDAACHREADLQSWACFPLCGLYQPCCALHCCLSQPLGAHGLLVSGWGVTLCSVGAATCALVCRCACLCTLFSSPLGPKGEP